MNQFFTKIDFFEALFFWNSNKFSLKKQTDSTAEDKYEMRNIHYGSWLSYSLTTIPCSSIYKNHKFQSLQVVLQSQGVMSKQLP